MTVRGAAIAVGITMIIAVSGCSASSGGTGGGGTGGSGAGGSGAGGSGAVSSAPTAVPSALTAAPSATTPTAASSAPTAPLPTTAAALRAFVRAGQRVDGTRYAFSAGATGAPLRANPGGELTVESPSGNISCDVRPVTATTSAETVCWVQQLAQRVPRPASCDHDWVAGIADLIAGRVTVGECLGGFPFGPYAKVLPYGSTITLGAMGCRSDPRFVACADLRTGAGFRADRTAITVVRA